MRQWFSEEVSQTFYCPNPYTFYRRAGLPPQAGVVGGLIYNSAEKPGLGGDSNSTLREGDASQARKRKMSSADRELLHRLFAPSIVRMDALVFKHAGRHVPDSWWSG